MAEENGELIESLDFLDSLPEALREPLKPLLQQVEGGYRFLRPEDPAPLKRKNAEILGEKKREQQKREELERQFSELRSKLKDGDDDIDLDAAVDAYRKSKAQPADAKQGADAIAEALREAKKKFDAQDAKKTLEFTALKTQFDTLQAEHNTTVCEGGLRRYCDSPKLPFKLQDGAQDTLVKLARAENPFVVKDGKWAMADGVSDDDGNPIETPEAWIAWQVAKQPFLLVPSSGGGAGNGSGTGTPGNLRQKKFEDMTDAERRELRKDPVAHEKALTDWRARQQKHRAAAA